MNQTYKNIVQTFSNRVFSDVEYNLLIDQLSDIYIENCGISKSFRTLAHEFAILLIQKHKKLDFHDSVNCFDAIMDKKWLLHREYDIVFLSQEDSIEVFETFKNLYTLKLS